MIEDGWLKVVIDGGLLSGNPGGGDGIHPG